ncbi:MAG: MBL fold metallo-hydrolase, partial [Actinobacteria bacterium]|nr:MBL fold metallo-hydrolase [Actinomycetota bacterium]
MASSPELVAPGVYRVDAIRPSNMINVLLLENDDGWTLVDTGTANSVGRIRDAITALGSGPEDLKRIFLTHQHDDHTSGLRGLLEWAPNAEAGASPHEAEVIS